MSVWDKFVTWKRYSGYEVSTHGDKRFSAFNAIMPDGRSIECHYQCDVKGYDVGGRNWRLGKGKRPLTKLSYDMCWQEYLKLWETWASNNMELMRELEVLASKHNNTLSDKFANTYINQARALAVVLNKLFKEEKIVKTERKYIDADFPF